MGFAKGFNQVEAAAEKAVRSIVEEHGYSLWDVVFVKEGAAWYLRILIDKPEGISIDDCESIDGLINAEIDKQPFIDKIDYLEVGSAGLERPIRRVDQLHASVGKRIRLKTYKLCEGLSEKNVRCVLKSFDGEKAVVSGDFGEAELLLSEISSMNYDDFDDFDEIITEV
ncbi:MAG: ribosome maturation factor RimP [Oscillospiraceae bacterium]|nr:ribosome maturation factor RimP [Oscillospiraceae bacterium]